MAAQFGKGYDSAGLSARDDYHSNEQRKKPQFLVKKQPFHFVQNSVFTLRYSFKGYNNTQMRTSETCIQNSLIVSSLAK